MGSLLERVNGPDDLKRLNAEELLRLAAELRLLIVETVAGRGGHLASSLGAVELTIALHTVFSSPNDAIIWDVGHQSYAHKIICGRREAFSSLRQKGGLSGFPRRDESEHDHFGTGHASTSVSAALGIAVGRDLARAAGAAGGARGAAGAVVAVIGDGAMTGGLAYEALNNAGQSNRDLIVVLNDNEMSIAPNVGAISLYLSRLRSDPRYSRVKADLESVLRRIPVVGDRLRAAVERVKDGVKYLILPGMLFEDLGFTYLGPVDGHSIPALQAVLHNARKRGGPVLVHAVTKKGKGYAPAERDPDVFHGTGPFDLATGRPFETPGPPSYSEVFGRALVEAAAADERVVAITAAMGLGTGLEEFARRFPSRFFDVGIAEGHAVTFAAGLAAAGLRPVVAIYSSFLQRAYDNIVHDVALQRLPVVFAIDRAGVVGEDGPTHHGALDIAFLRHIPGFTVMAPRDEVELAEMLRYGLRCGGPASIRYPRGACRGIPEGAPLEPLGAGRAELLRRGGDIAILALGSMVYPALAAAKALAEGSVRAAVVNARFASPVDSDLIVDLAGRTGRLVTAEEGVVAGGFGAAVLEALAAAGVPARVRCLGLPAEMVPHGARGELLSEHGLDAQGIAGAARSLLEGRGAAAAVAGRRA